MSSSVDGLPSARETQLGHIGICPSRWAWHRFDRWTRSDIPGLNPYLRYPTDGYVELISRGTSKRWHRLRATVCLVGPRPVRGHVVMCSHCGAFGCGKPGLVNHPISGGAWSPAAAVSEASQLAIVCSVRVCFIAISICRNSASDKVSLLSAYPTPTSLSYSCPSHHGRVREGLLSCRSTCGFHVAASLAFLRSKKWLHGKS